MLFPLNRSVALAENASVTAGEFSWFGGPGRFSAEATWGGGTVSLQMKTENGSWVAVGADTTMTASGAAGFILPTGTKIRAAITTATAVFAYVSPMP